MKKQFLHFLLLLISTSLFCQAPTASFATWKDNRTAAYSIIHDDYSSWVTGIFQYADPIATARGVKLAFGAITSGCGPTEWTKANTMIGHGHECINHTHSHNCGGSASNCFGQTSYSTADYPVELLGSTDIIQANTSRRPRFFIHPYDAVVAGDATSNAILSYLTSIGYLGTRAGSQDANNASTYSDFMHLNFHVYDGTQSLTTLNNVVSSAISSGSYAVREFHGIEDGSWAAMTIANYTSHLDFVKTQIDNGALWSATPTQAITYSLQRNAYQPVPTYIAATGNINVNFNVLQTLNATVLSVLNTPMSASVTVNVNIGSLTSTFNVFQNNNVIPSIRSGNVLTFNVYPHLGGVELRCTACSAPTPANVTNLVSTPSVSSLGLTWTNPAAANMTEIMVVASTASFTALLPTGDGTGYTADASFTGIGTAFDGGKVVFKGATTTANITNLASLTPYNYKVFTRLGIVWSTGVSGTATTTATSQPINVTNLTGTPASTTLALSWTNPPAANMTQIMVVASTTPFTSLLPTGNGTTYTANAAFTGAGTAFDGGKVVYKNTGASVNITGLIGTTQYYYKVFTRLGTVWSSGVVGTATTTNAALPVNVTNITSSITTSTMTLAWTNPPAANMTQIMVVASTTPFTSLLPTGNGSTYTANASFPGAGTAFDGGKVVFKGTVATMTITGLAENTVYYYKVFTRLTTTWSTGVIGNAKTAATPSGSCANGKLTRQVWTGIALNTYTIADLKTDVRYPNTPTTVDEITTTYESTDRGDAYGERIFGYLIPAVTGSHTFTITGDDDVELYLSTNATAASKVKIAGFTGYTSATQYTKYAGQKSVAINLTAGVAYYVEALHIGTTGTNFMAVHWQTPTITSISKVPSYAISTASCAAALQRVANDNLANQVQTTPLSMALNFDAIEAVSIRKEAKIMLRASSYRIFPNPATLFLDIDLSAANGQIVDIAVMTLMGQTVKQDKIQSGLSLHRMNLEGLSNGQYMVRIQAKGQPSNVQKLVIMK
jgi:hypothetical protein